MSDTYDHTDEPTDANHDYVDTTADGQPADRPVDQMREDEDFVPGVTPAAVEGDQSPAPANEVGPEFSGTDPGPYGDGTTEAFHNAEVVSGPGTVEENVPADAVGMDPNRIAGEPIDTASIEGHPDERAADGE